MAYKILRAVKMNGKIIKYVVQNLENQETAEIRIPQIETFSILKVFTNAVAKDKSFTAKEEGFETIEIDAMSVEERKERARIFAEELMHTNIAVTGCYEKYVGETPRKYVLSALGQVGNIGIYPGTEYFNKGILNLLKFDRVNLGECNSINPSHGFRDRYVGWNINVPEERDESKIDAYFTVDNRPYSTPDFLTNAGINGYEVFYVVMIRGNIRCNVWINKENKILYISALR